MFNRHFNTIINYIGNRKVGYIRMLGSAGDNLIEEATYQFFRRNNIQYKIVNINFFEYDVNDVDILVISGGANLGKNYPKCYQIRKDISQFGIPMMVLPQTLYGPMDDIVYDKIYARDYVTSYLLGVTIVPDMAFQYKLDFELPQKNKDSGVFVARQNTKYQNENIGCPYNIAKNSKDFLLLLNQYKYIITDKLHAAIGGLIVGSKVKLLEGSYFKNKSMWLTWLKSLNVEWEDG